MKPIEALPILGARQEKTNNEAEHSIAILFLMNLRPKRQ